MSSRCYCLTDLTVLLPDRPHGVKVRQDLTVLKSGKTSRCNCLSGPHGVIAGQNLTVLKSGTDLPVLKSGTDLTVLLPVGTSRCYCLSGPHGVKGEDQGPGSLLLQHSEKRLRKVAESLSEDRGVKERGIVLRHFLRSVRGVLTNGIA